MHKVQVMDNIAAVCQVRFSDACGVLNVVICMELYIANSVPGKRGSHLAMQLVCLVNWWPTYADWTVVWFAIIVIVVGDSHFSDWQL